MKKCMLLLLLRDITGQQCLMFFTIYHVIFKFNFVGKNLLSFLWAKYFKWSLKGKKFCILLSLTDVSVIFRRVSFREWRINEAQAITSINLLFVDSEDLGLGEKACMVTQGEDGRGGSELRAQRHLTVFPQHTRLPANCITQQNFSCTQYSISSAVNTECVLFLPTTWFLQPCIMPDH